MAVYQKQGQRDMTSLATFVGLSQSHRLIQRRRGKKPLESSDWSRANTTVVVSLFCKKQQQQQQQQHESIGIWSSRPVDWSPILASLINKSPNRFDSLDKYIDLHGRNDTWVIERNQNAACMPEIKQPNSTAGHFCCCFCWLLLAAAATGESNGTWTRLLSSISPSVQRRWPLLANQRQHTIQ